ncbi:class A beta-lactamase-related serine hydrolase [Mesorhizobium sp. M2D.F.Ca.ET.185.01.1.1]|uniref:serine hydrolase domain-containing protein n=3 Tax=Mesorhizobium TaxID=68287 RepID=UPI000FCA8A93|nr:MULTISPECIES: serine hydrolase domain-containing protein [unclassified Mesorhizobium]TGP83552.1 class A beta-lactamase-related serine hydrolase [bacterium M00.F.Ca.ET.227.01.1.1]TGP99507.1 class A beta-lactamase-related serine hydrolase [bacterium M00.F.Ca.ET.221.01.1.1]TGQ00236.1 class A beta-lactamase-related serine hydrolase [bacterium M00.F.Ca.ET.222.01.1.1]TGU11623.1 class A beta-lactamase-related serine hydrolase [bacterium M00.F.Ca.ET.163.01.1.1]TGU35222.1 class A beta-lactamase-rela
MLRRLRAWPVLFVLCVAWLSRASAKPNEVAAKVDAAVTSWMAERHIADAEVAVALHKDIVGAFDHGWKATDRQPVASLSKAITGLCIAGLVDHKQLSLDEPLGTALGGYFARKHKDSEPKDPRFKTITIEELLTHRAGLKKNAFDDKNDHSLAASFRTATRTMLDFDPGGTVSYSDSGYLVLGYVAQLIGGRPYPVTCGKVFTRLGMPANTGTIDATLAARAPNGGWDISADDYARFLYAFDPQSGVLGPKTRQWLDTLAGDPGYAKGQKSPPTQAPCPRFSGKPAYGFGVCMKRTARGTQYYHDGLLHHHMPDYPKTGGSFFFVNEAGYAAVVIFSGENDGKTYAALEKSVIAAMTESAAYDVPEAPSSKDTAPADGKAVKKP